MPSSVLVDLSRWSELVSILIITMPTRVSSDKDWYWPCKVNRCLMGDLGMVNDIVIRDRKEIR